MSSKDAPKLSVLQTLQGHTGSILCARFNSHGTYCLSGGKDRSIRLWNPTTGGFIKQYDGHGYEVRGIAVWRDNKQFVSCGGDRQVYIWDVSKGIIIRRFRGHEGVVDSVDLDSSGSIVVSGGGDKCVKVWDCRSRNTYPIQTMSHFKDSVTCVHVTPDATILACSVDGTVVQYDPRRGVVHRTTCGPALTHVVSTSSSTKAASSPTTSTSSDATYMLVLACDDSVYLLEGGAGSGAVLGVYRGHMHKEVKLEGGFLCDDSLIFAGSEDGRVCVWDVVGGGVVWEGAGHKGAVCTVDVHGKGGVITGGADGVVKVWR